MIISPKNTYRFLSSFEASPAEEKVYSNYEVYITLASLLHFIETENGLYNGDSPQIKFDFNYDYFGLTNNTTTEIDNNYFLSPPTQFSADPRVCLIPSDKGTLNRYFELFNQKGTPDIEDQISPSLEEYEFKNNPNSFVGKLGYIFLNINYLAGVLNSLTKEEDGVATLVKLLQQIMDDVNVCLGGINNFIVYVDKDDLTIKIYDQTPMPYQGSDYDITREPDKFTTLNIFGVKPGVEGSFVQDISLNSEISNNFSTAISVGAQADSTNISQNAYSFEKYNEGLTDRIVKEKTSKNSSGGKYTENDSPIDFAKAVATYRQVYEKKQLTDENIDFLKNANSQINTILMRKYAKDGYIDAPFFIPYNLNMTLDGISGIKLFEKFKTSKGVLPLTYDEDRIALIVKAISHTVDTKQWTTKIETLSYPEASGSLKTYSPPNSDSQTNTSTAARATTTATTAANSKMSDFTFNVYPNWVPTVKGSTVTVTSLPTPNRNINGRIKNHYGVDIAGAIGTRIISPVDGVVRNGLFGANGGGFGDQFVIIQENGTRNFHIFGHNNTREGNAKINGNQIKKGEIIATIGNKGYSTGPHLHYEIRKDSVQSSANRLDPVKYLNSFPSLSLAAVKKSEKTYS